MIRWHGDNVMREIRKLESRRVDAAGRVLRDYIKEHISTPSSKRSGGQRSQAGEFPHKDLGHLRRNIQAEHDRSIATSRVGTNVLYGKYLELGTRKMARRPWLSRGLAESLGRMRRVIERGSIV